MTRAGFHGFRTFATSPTCSSAYGRRVVEDSIPGEFLEEPSDDAGVGKHRRDDRVPSALQDDREGLRRRGQNASESAAFRLLSKDFKQARGLEPTDVIVDLLFVDLESLRQGVRVVGRLRKLLHDPPRER